MEIEHLLPMVLSAILGMLQSLVVCKTGGPGATEHWDNVYMMRQKAQQKCKLASRALLDASVQVLRRLDVSGKLAVSLST